MIFTHSSVRSIHYYFNIFIHFFDINYIIEDNFADLIVLNLKLLDCTEGRLHCCIIAKKIILPAIYDRLFNIYLKCVRFNDF